MITDTPITAPVLNEYHQIYTRWKRNHLGDHNAFYSFMTAPSVERERFLADFCAGVWFTRGVAVLRISEKV